MAGLVTAALIVRDEGLVLAECLRSISGVVDEIVVVDTGSVDDSVAIAADFGARVHRRAWTDHFAEARNAALDEAGGEWILYIDADERLAPVDRSEVEALLAGAPEVAFRVLLRPFERATPYREYRLWRNDPRIRFEGVIHEKVVPSIHAVSRADRRPIGVCDLLLTHVGYEGDQTHKHERNLPLLRAQVLLEPDNLFNRHHLSRVLAGLGFAQQAEEALVHAVDIARGKRYVDPVGVLAYTELIDVRRARGEDVRELLAEARKRYPANWVLVWTEGRVLIDEGRYEEAIDRFERLEAVDTSRLPDDGPAYDERLFGEIAHDTRGLCLFRLGRYDDAAAAYAAAERSAPEDPTYGAKRQLALARARRQQAESTATGARPPGPGR